jgi:photosystem II stability/assembly factor-like uncharacterized protein
MKKIILLFIIALCTLNIENCMSQWVWQYPTPQGNGLIGVEATNSNTLFSVGASGTYIKSTDGGLSWNVQHFLNGKTANFNFIRFINQYTGWICGDSGYIAKTTNAGGSWTEQYSNSQTKLSKLFFLNENYGFAIGSNGTVLRTIDGGVNWVSIFTNNTYYYFYDCFFNNQNTGYICGTNGSGPYPSSLFFKTTNAGANWTSLGLTVNYCVYFVNDQVGFASGSDGWSGHQFFHKTSNGGVNWQGTMIDSIGFSNLFFINENTGWTRGGNGVWKTTNGCASWTRQSTYSAGTYGYISYMRFLDTNIFIGIGGVHIVKYTNGGNNWIELSKGESLSTHNKIQFLNENTGLTDAVSGLMKTTDSGNNWIYTEIPNVSEITGFHFIDNNTGWVQYWSHNKWALIATTNGGINYYTPNIDTINNINQIYFVNQNTGFLSYDSNNLSPHFIKLFRTTNSGVNWQLTFRLNGFQASFIHFVNSSTGFALFKNNNYYNDNYIYKTTNGGINWYQQGIAVSNLYAIRLLFVNETTGYISYGSSGTIQASILKTTNGGMNWQDLNLEYLNLYQLGNLNFINSLTGFATQTGYDNTNALILSTTNGGLNWSLTYPGPAYSVANMFFLNSQTGWLTTTGGGIMKTTNLGSLFIKKISEETPSSFSLSQNYPNPFNPTTSIKYSVSGIQNVKLVIYDILGKEIETLVNEKQSPSAYEVTFDGSKYASGIYFYTLIAGEYKETKKLVLLK